MTQPSKSKEESRQPVSLYRLRAGYLSDFEKKFPRSGGKNIATNESLEGYFYPIPADPEPPSWLGLIAPLLEDSTNIDLFGQHPGGLLAIMYQQKHFIFTFGHAWASLKDEWIEPNFGKRIALNAIPRDQLTELKAEQVFAAWHLSSERAPAPTSVSKFGLESGRDLVHIIEGKPTLPVAAFFGSSIRGGTSLKISIQFSKLKQVLDLVISLEQKNDYKTIWPEIDNLHVVKDQTVIDVLHTKLDSELNSQNTSSLVLVAPTLKNGDAPIPQGFLLGRLPTKGKNSRPSCAYLLLGNWFSYLKKHQKTPTVETAKETGVHFLDADSESIATVRLYDCIGFETSIAASQTSNVTYVLSAGTWYEASLNFINTINGEIASLIAPTINPLKNWDQVQTEGEYNFSCVSQELYLFDAKNIHFGGGQSKFEFCDLYHEPSKTLYFVKHVSASNHFSHLSEQVRRTVELVFGPDDIFRAKLIAKINKLHPKLDTTWLKGRPQQRDINLCIVSMGKHYKDYPFFAKCGLARLLKELRRANHNVTFLNV